MKKSRKLPATDIGAPQAMSNREYEERERKYRAQSALDDIERAEKQ